MKNFLLTLGYQPTYNIAFQKQHPSYCSIDSSIFTAYVLLEATKNNACSNFSSEQLMDGSDKSDDISEEDLAISIEEMITSKIYQEIFSDTFY